MVNDKLKIKYLYSLICRLEPINHVCYIAYKILIWFITIDKALDEQCYTNTAGECSDINAQCLANPVTTLCTCTTGYYKFTSSAGVSNCQPGK